MLAHTSGFENWSENIVGCDANGSQEPFSMQRERERETHTYKIITPASMNVFAGMRREPLREKTTSKKTKKKQAVMSVQNQPGPWQS